MLAVYYSAGVAGAVLLLQLLQRHVLIFCIVALPGTIAHELSHYVVGWITHGKPRSFSIVPRRHGNAYILGAVTLANVRWYNGLFIGLSPLMLIPAAVLLIQWRIATTYVNIISDEIIWGYFAATLINGGVLSRQDIKIAMTSIWWAFPGLVLGCVYYLAELGVISGFV